VSNTTFTGKKGDFAGKRNVFRKKQSNVAVKFGKDRDEGNFPAIFGGKNCWFSGFF
jgi:hypothetical protein